jgi:carboxyl-terminal processing protease
LAEKETSGPRPGTLRFVRSRTVLAIALTAALFGAGVCGGLYAKHAYVTLPSHPVTAQEHKEKAVPAPAPSGPRDDEDEDGQSSGYAFHMPSGRPTAVACDEAKRIVAQVCSTMAAPPAPVDPRAFVDSASDWLDPHALWTVAPDSPKEAFTRELRALLPELESSRGACRASEASGAVVAAWVDELRATFDAARRDAKDADADAAKSPLPTSEDAKKVAKDLGAKVGAFERALGPEGKKYGDYARERFFPKGDAHAWGEIVLSAAVRAYVPLVDPHGAWAPYDEEASVYDVDLAANAPEALWARGDLTSVGVAIVEGPVAPFEVGDVVLSIADLPTAGLPLEQIEQLGFVASDAKTKVPAVVLRGKKLVSLSVGGPPAAGAPKKEPESFLTTERISWGASNDVLVVAIHDVRDDLGDDLTHVLRDERSSSKRPLAGVVLDLRGNGGGSTDGAMQALGLFMPGVPLFPMKRRDGTIEIERSTEPAEDDRFRGPVATLVDGATASAAEMMAGAFMAYGRGPSLGMRTFGKGCAQEYFDDEPRTGVLRLTTLLYALPDGAPVQRVGLLPTLEVPFESPQSGKMADREASLAHAPPTWRGPDMRGPRPRVEPWAPLREPVGECRDADVCSSLRVLSEGWPRRGPLVVAKKRRK